MRVKVKLGGYNGGGQGSHNKKRSSSKNEQILPTRGKLHRV